MPGIIEVTGDLETEMVVVKYEPAEVTTQQIVQAIESAGFNVAGTFQP